MNLLDCRLALFLDPRYKAVADAPGTCAKLVITVRERSENKDEALLPQERGCNPVN